MLLRPQNDRYAIRRRSGELPLNWGLVLPEFDTGTALEGMIEAAGARRNGAPMECSRGDRVLYSSRVDSYRLANGDCIDIVDEASVMTKLL